jgi:hypothetical protein
MLFNRQRDWALAENARNALEQPFAALGFSKQWFESCLIDQKMLDEIRLGRKWAETELGLASVPTFFVGADMYLGTRSVEEFSVIIDNALNATEADKDATQEVAAAPEEEITLSRTIAPDETTPDEVCHDSPDEISYCATSVLAPQGDNSYDPSMLFDGDNTTAWVEADPEEGLGQSITLYFGAERQLSGFDILNGYDKDEKTLANNARVRGATLALSDGKSFEIELPDLRENNRFEFSRPVKTESVTITIDSVYEGKKYTDTAISELYPVFAD